MLKFTFNESALRAELDRSLGDLQEGRKYQYASLGPLELLYSFRVTKDSAQLDMLKLYLPLSTPLLLAAREFVDRKIIFDNAIVGRDLFIGLIVDIAAEFIESISAENVRYSLSNQVSRLVSAAKEAEANIAAIEQFESLLDERRKING